jgi:hypothetical protein
LMKLLCCRFQAVYAKETRTVWDKNLQAM